MKNSALISVIIPIYNAEKYIQQTIQSVLSQTYNNFELIIVDDGSTDATPALIQEISAHNSKIKLITQKNTGVSVARNTGFTASKGNYIAFLDADDIWLPNFLEITLSKFTADSTLGLVHCDNQVIDANSKLTTTINRGLDNYTIDSLLFAEAGTYIFSINAVLLKRNVIETVGGFDIELSNGADHEFFYRVANCFKIGRVPKVGLLYRIHDNNMHFNIQLLEKDTLLAYKKASEYDFFKSKSFKRQCYSNMYFMLAGSWWKNAGNKSKGLKYLIYSIAIYPQILLKLFKKLT